MCLPSLAYLSRTADAEESTEYKETIYVNVFFGFPYGEELILVKNIDLVFENIIYGPPINLTALNDGFIKLKCDLVSAGNKSFVSFNVYFDSSVDNITACSQADDIIQEFLAVFGYQGLELLWKNSGPNEGMMWVHKSFGYIPYTTDSVISFLKYKPSTNFARFIDNLVKKYVPTGGLLPSYTLRRIGMGFYWSLEILGTEYEQLALDVHEYSSIISVKEMLNTNLPLVEQPRENQQIIILIEKNRSLEIGSKVYTYTIDIKSVRPEGFTIRPSDWANYVEITYEPLLPMENIIVELTVNSYTEKQTPTWIWAVVAIIVSLTLLAISVLFLKKKREGDEKAVAKAQEYYQKHLKPEEKKEEKKEEKNKFKRL